MASRSQRGVALSVSGIAFAVMGVVATGQAAPLSNPEPILWSSTIAAVPLDSAAGQNGEHVELVDNSGTRVLRWRRSDGSLPSSNTFILGNWGDRIGVDRVGRVCVVGTMPGQPGIYLRVVDRSGAQSVATRRIDEGTGSGDLVGNATAAMSASGICAATWRRYVPSSGTSDIKLLLFNSDGTPRLAARTVAAAVATTHFATDLALDAAGNVSVVWMSAPGTAAANTWLQRFDSTGWPLGGQVLLNTSGINAREPRVAAAPSGRSVAVWAEAPVGANSAVIWARRFDEAGAAQGASFVVNSSANNDLLADVGMMEDGGFVAVWNNRGSSGNPMIPPALQGREYRSDGAAMGAAFKVTSGAEPFVAVSMDLAGGFVVMWRSLLDGVTMGRRYVADAVPPVVSLQDGVAVAGIASSTPGRRLYRFANPEGRPSLLITMTGDGDADVIVRYAALPSATLFDAYPALAGSNEQVQFVMPPAGDFYLEVATHQPFSDVRLVVSTQGASAGGGGGGGEVPGEEPGPVQP